MPLTYKTVGSTYLVAAYSTLFPATGTLGSVTATTVTINNLSANYTYTINRYTGATATGTPVVLVTGYNVGSSGPTFLDNGATANTQYTYTVVGTNSYTATSPVNLGTIWTLANATLAATTATPTGETISWTNPAYASITITNNTNPSATVTYNSMTPLSWIDTLDTAGNTTYTYTVSVKNGGGISTTLSTNLSVSTISAITNVVATSTVAGQISVTWSGGLSPVAPTYTLSLLSGTGTTIGSTTISSGASTTTAGSATLTLSSTASIVTGITVSATNSYETVSGNTSTNVTTLPSTYNTINNINYSGTNYTTWSGSLSSGNGIISTTGTTNGTNYKVYAFGNMGVEYTINYTSAAANTIYVMAVGGGGAGGNNRAGGGGGGGVYSGSVSVGAGSGTIKVTIGGGGAGGPNQYNGASGGGTIVTFSGNIATYTILAQGGDGGKTQVSNGGGGNSGLTSVNGTMISAGFTGGTGNSNGYGGGGAGAGQNGGNNNGGTDSYGGAGVQVTGLNGVSNATLNGHPVSYWYWGGGGGGQCGTNGNGGIGGGGAADGSYSPNTSLAGGGQSINPGGSSTTGTVGSGGANTGGGGGGGAYNISSGSGGSGIVIIAFG